VCVYSLPLVTLPFPLVFYPVDIKQNQKQKMYQTHPSARQENQYRKENHQRFVLVINDLLGIYS
jgi:hypothetical protein